MSSRSNFYAISDIYASQILRENFAPSQQSAPATEPQASVTHSVAAPGQLIDDEEDCCSTVVDVLVNSGGYQVTDKLPDGSCILNKQGSTVTVRSDGTIEAINS